MIKRESISKVQKWKKDLWPFMNYSRLSQSRMWCCRKGQQQYNVSSSVRQLCHVPIWTKKMQYRILGDFFTQSISSVFQWVSSIGRCLHKNINNFCQNFDPSSFIFINFTKIMPIMDDYCSLKQLLLAYFLAQIDPLHYGHCCKYNWYHIFSIF